MLLAELGTEEELVAGELVVGLSVVGKIMVGLGLVVG
jgi:hypothetical protein